ncbi:MAG: type IV pilin protein [Magnetococcus sp. YQC-5]
MMTQQHLHKRDRPPCSMPQGFTLVELLIVVAIVGILAAAAYPSFQDSMIKSRRADAQQLMVAIANKQEAYLMDAMNYTADFTALNFTNDGWTCTAASCSNNYYTVTITLHTSYATRSGFTITATPKTSSQTNDGILTLSSLGAKTRNGVSGW